MYLRRVYTCPFVRAGIVPFVLGAVAFHSSTARAACDDAKKTALLSNGWFLAEIDCAADKLIDAGEDLLVDAAKDILKSAVNAYLPGLGELLNFGGKDPFAKDLKIILDAIQGADQDVLNAVWCDRTDQALKVSLPTVQSEFNTTMLYSAPTQEETLHYQIARGGVFDILEDNLTNLRQTLRNLRNVFGLDALHSLVAVTQMSLETSGRRSYLTALDGYTDDSAIFANLPASTVAMIDEAARAGCENQYNTILADPALGILPYFEDLAETNLYRVKNDESFSAWASYDPSLQYTAVTTYKVSGGTAACKKPDANRPETWTDGFVTTSETFTIVKQGSIAPSSCVVRGHTVSLPGVRLATTLPDGSVITANAYHTCTVNAAYQLTGYIDANTAIRALIAKHKVWAHRRNLLVAYGSIRPIIDRWYRMVGDESPQSVYSADLDLDAYRLRTFDPNLPVLADEDLDRRKNAPLPLVSYFLAGFQLPSLDLLESNDVRALANFVSTFGTDELVMVINAAYSNPFRPTPEQILSVIRDLDGGYGEKFASASTAIIMSVL